MQQQIAICHGFTLPGHVVLDAFVAGIQSGNLVAQYRRWSTA